MSLGFFHHAFDIVLLQVGRGSDGHFLFAAGGLVFGGHVDDTVSVNIKGHFYLRDAARGRRNAFQAEAAQAHVI
ncbi:hypothetical protein SDC9_107345 [bioreactor metagenome]|uniref:Uncharacterized protein n=1 Tax=bioreactor metagenome TaxID=1076179 RepID=A0A645BFJ5_9ZZZZ